MTALTPHQLALITDPTQVQVQDQIVTDQQGRRRFHGAFTGGFSAGYFNTVGSKEGQTCLALGGCRVADCLAQAGSQRRSSRPDALRTMATLMSTAGCNRKASTTLWTRRTWTRAVSRQNRSERRANSRSLRTVPQPSAKQSVRKIPRLCPTYKL